MTQNTKSLIEEAREAVDAGFVLAGLLQAGVAFEQAVVAKAKAHNLMYGYRSPLGVPFCLIKKVPKNQGLRSRILGIKGQFEFNRFLLYDSKY